MWGVSAMEGTALYTVSLRMKLDLAELGDRTTHRLHSVGSTPDLKDQDRIDTKGRAVRLLLKNTAFLLRSVRHLSINMASTLGILSSTS